MELKFKMYLVTLEGYNEHKGKTAQVIILAKTKDGALHRFWECREARGAWTPVSAEPIKHHWLGENKVGA